MHARRPPDDPLAGIEAITFDFGNTLVPVDRAGLHRVVEATARAMASRSGPFEVAAVLQVWAEERERQFREEVPAFREVDLAERVVRVLARLRGMAPPPPDGRWDQTEAARRSSPDEVDWIVEQYSRAFVDAMPPRDGVGDLLTALAGSFRLAILSNWPLAATVDRYAEAAGWTPALTAIVVSQRVGVIKPHPAIFAAAAAALEDPEPSAILHVGDDWNADVAGPKAVGWRAAHVRARPEDSPLPSSERGAGVVADLELDDVTDLVRLLPGGPRGSRPGGGRPVS
ncbi:MAG TPA: HAD family hydrolase [Candidatus Limnocylindrales bacterium]|nr:HAD family hydrolase [Candidatus Limnocylindrales bacterium]